MDVLSVLPVIQMMVNKYYIPSTLYGKEDVSQACVVIALELLDKNTNSDTFEAFLKKHLYHKIMSMRDCSNTLHQEVEQESTSEEYRYILVETQELIDQYKDDLDEYHAAILEHAIIEQDMKLSEIARMYGKNEKMIYSVRSRVYNEFYDYLIGEHYVDDY